VGTVCGGGVIDEGGDDLGECAEVKVDETSHGVAAEHEVVRVREKSGLSGTVAGFGRGVELPTVGAIPSYSSSLGSEPTVENKGLSNWGRTERIGEQFGVERKDTSGTSSSTVDDEVACEVGRSPTFRIEPMSTTDVESQVGDEGYVDGELVGEMVRETAADHDEVNTLRQVFITQRGELSQVCSQGF
jgi:hypothetical protein